MCTITYTSKLIRRRSTLKGKPIWCCAAVKSNVHSRTNAQNVSYFQLMWKLAPFFRKIKIIRNIKLILALKINFSKPNFGDNWPNLLKSLHCRLNQKYLDRTYILLVVSASWLSINQIIIFFFLFDLLGFISRLELLRIADPPTFYILETFFLALSEHDS